MAFFTRAITSFAIASALISPCAAQNPEPTVFTEQATGISLDTWSIQGGSTAGGLTFGMALPRDGMDTDAAEFIGYLHCNATSDSKKPDGWCGISLGGAMTDSLLLIAYPDENAVKTSLRFASDYKMPGPYTGNASIAEISHSVNETSFSVLFHCKECLHWSQNKTDGSVSTSSGMVDLGYAQSVEGPGNPSCAAEATLAQHDLQGTFTAMLDEGGVSDSYEDWRELAGEEDSAVCGSDGGN